MFISTFIRLLIALLTAKLSYCSKCPGFGKFGSNCITYSYCNNNSTNLVCGNGLCGGIVCPSGWINYKNKTCYSHLLNGRAHAEAENYCKSQKALLVSFSENREEKLALIGNNNTAGNSSIWMGIRMDAESNYYWMDGSRLERNDSMWCQGEKSDYFVDACITLEKRQHSGACYMKNDCRMNVSFICETGIEACVNSTCKCRLTDYYDGEKCVALKSHNQSCSHNSECNSNAGLTCQLGYCKCTANDSRCNECRLIRPFQKTVPQSAVANTMYSPTSSLIKLMTIEMAIINGEPYYFMADNDKNGLIKINSTWNYISFIFGLFASPRVIKSANGYLYITANNELFKTDYNFNIINRTKASFAALYNGIYHNSKDNTLAIAVMNRNRVDWIDANLTDLGSLPLGTYSPVGVSGYNDSLYVSAYRVSSTVIFVIRNRVIINTLSISNTTAIEIYSILFDQCGYMALAFRQEKTANLYDLHGNHVGLQITLPYEVFHLSFDFYNSLMIGTADSVYFYN